MDDFKRVYDDTKGLFWSNLVGTLSWIIFLVKLLSYNKVLLNMVDESDGMFIRAFKLVFSDEVSNMGLYLLVAFLLIIWLVVNIYKNMSTMFNYQSYDNTVYYIYVPYIVIQLGGIIALFFSILAPILVSFIIMMLVIIGIIYANSDS